MVKKFFRWVFSNKIAELEKQISESKSATEKLIFYEKRLSNVLSNIDVSVDVHDHHEYSKNWAVISIQGKRTDFIKFVDLGNSDIHEIQRFLKKFERDANIKIDASPAASMFLKMQKK